MKKIITLILTLVWLLSFAGCGKNQTVEEAAPGDLPPQVMVDGVIYVDTGKESTVTDRKDDFDGKITSSVKADESPAQDDQSNFGTGYGYQFGEREGTIELCINDSWWVYATSEVRDQIFYPERYEVVDKIPKLTISYGEEIIDDPRIGVASWEYTKEDGTEGALLGDGAQPLDAKHASPFFVLDPYADTSFEIWLSWDLMPDSVMVRYWDESCWGELEAEPTGRELLKEGNEAGDAYYLVPQEGNYIYEVIATWENAPNYSGKVNYNFHTVMKDTEQDPYEAYISTVAKGKYHYVDLDEDGEQELFIRRDANESEIVTVLEGKAVSVLSANHLFLCEGGIIGRYGEGGGGCTVFYYKLDDHEAVPVDVIMTTFNDDAWYHSNDSKIQAVTPQNMTRITKEDAQKVCEQYALLDDSMPAYLTWLYAD